MPEEQQPESNSPAPKISGARRRGRRGGRGRRRPAPVNPVSDQSVQGESPSQNEPPIRLREEMPVRPSPSKPKFPSAASVSIESTKEKFRPAPRDTEPDGSAISRAIGEVMRIVDSLKQALEQMEEVLELVELAERQKIADEREIENLRRALRKIQMPRERPDPEEPSQQSD